MIKLRIEGMTCGHCVATVTRVLESAPGIEKVVEVSLDRAEAVLDGTADPAALITSLAAEGYRAELVI